MLRWLPKATNFSLGRHFTLPNCSFSSRDFLIPQPVKTLGCPASILRPPHPQAPRVLHTPAWLQPSRSSHGSKLPNTHFIPGKTEAGLPYLSSAPGR